MVRLKLKTKKADVKERSCAADDESAAHEPCAGCTPEAH